MADKIVLESKNITKIYPGTTALSEVGFKVREGKVNILIGENGAGKSTLMKIIAGVEEQTSGEIYIDNLKVQYKSPLDALEHGVGIIYQELNLFPNLSIAENIFMTHEKKINSFTIDHKKQETETKVYLDKLKLFIDPSTLIKDLRVGQQQIVEIAKVLSQNAKVIIMDEPTSALSQEEVLILFSIIEELKSNNVSIIYISHRLEEVMAIGDYITILRDGKFIEEAMVKDINIAWIVDRMTGGNTVDRIETDRVPQDVLLEVKNLSLQNSDNGKMLLNNISFSLRKGEILGFFGLRGAGRTELLECLVGAQPTYKGTVLLESKEIVSKDINTRIKEGFALIPEDRKNLAIFPDLNIKTNMTVSNLSAFTKYHVIDSAKESSTVDEYIKDLRVKVPANTALISSLSGGNQQKVVIGKSLLTNVKVLLMDEPTRGIDIAAKRDVFNICEKLASQGLGIIFISSEIQEMLAIPDRVIVLSTGKIKGEFQKNELTEEKLIAASAIDLNATE